MMKVGIPSSDCVTRLDTGTGTGTGTVNLAAAAMFGCLDVWMFGCLDVWMFGCLDVWMFGCLDVWMFGWTWVFFSNHLSALFLLSRVDFINLDIPVIRAPV
eukprot:scaffold36122_cov67-Attheya_sp.AAC.2